MFIFYIHVTRMSSLVGSCSGHSGHAMWKASLVQVRIHDGCRKFCFFNNFSFFCSFIYFFLMFLMIFSIWMFTWSSGYLPYVLSLVVPPDMLKVLYFSENQFLSRLSSLITMFCWHHTECSLSLSVLFSAPAFLHYSFVCFFWLYVSWQVSNAAFCWGERLAIKMHFSCFFSPPC